MTSPRFAAHARIRGHSMPAMLGHFDYSLQLAERLQTDPAARGLFAGVAAAAQDRPHTLLPLSPRQQATHGPRHRMWDTHLKYLDEFLQVRSSAAASRIFQPLVV